MLAVTLLLAAANTSTFPAGCVGGKVYDAGLCYRRCKSGYKGVGPVCWEKCPAGTRDIGALCTKGARPHRKKSYGRGVGTVPPICKARSFDKPVPAATGPRTFTMIFASDTQLPWWTRDGRCKNEACTLAIGRKTNGEQVAAINGITRLRWPDGHAVQKPQGVVLNGDLTAFWHDWQLELFEEYWTNKESIHLPVFPGLGNHDYANNVRDCWWVRDLGFFKGKNGCAQSAVNWMKAAVSCGKAEPFPARLVQRFDTNSLAYSWNVGSWHFVQLHNRPDYAEAGIGIRDSFAWLKADLAAATAAGRRSVLNFHDYGDHMKQDDARFLAAIAGQRVAAVFAGHIHQDSGYVGAVPGRPEIPIYRSGSSEHQTFLLAEFGPDRLTVASISSEGGAPRLLSEKLHTATLR